MQAVDVDGKFVPTPTPGDAAIIKLTQVVKDYPTPEGAFRALSDINLEIHPGEFVAVIGKSGAGKTTLVNMITGVDQVTSGEVQVGGANLGNMDENQLAQWRGMNLGIIYQSFHLLPGLSIVDNVMLPMDFCGNYHRKHSRVRAMELLRQVELQDHAHKKPSEISGGQQQRVAIARALANEPAIIMADEPTGRLDSQTAEAIFQIFEQLVAQGKTIVMVTHDQGLVRRASRTLQIVDGRVINHGD